MVRVMAGDVGDGFLPFSHYILSKSHQFRDIFFTPSFRHFHPLVSHLLSLRFSTQSPSAPSPQSFWPHSQSRQLLPLVGKVVSTNQNDFSHQWQKSIQPAERRYLKISNITNVKTKYWSKSTKNHHHPHLPSP